MPFAGANSIEMGYNPAGPGQPDGRIDGGEERKEGAKKREPHEYLFVQSEGSAAPIRSGQAAGLICWPCLSR